MKDMNLKMNELEIIEEMTEAEDDAITRVLGVLGLVGCITFGITLT